MFKRGHIMNEKIKTEAVDHLFRSILTLKDTEECYKFFEDLCTINELLSLSQRLEVAKMLREKKTYLEIADKTGVNLMLIGKYNGGMDSFISEHHLKDRVQFTGMVDYKKVPQLLMDAAVLALARPDSIQAQNGFPTKLGEYLLTGNPVVITKVGDIPLFLEHKKTALLTDSHDTDAFAANLLWAIEHPIEAQEIGAGGREVALKNFNYQIETSKMADAMFSE